MTNRRKPKTPFLGPLVNNRDRRVFRATMGIILVIMLIVLALTYWV